MIIQLEAARRELEQLSELTKELGGTLKIDRLESERNALDAKTKEDDFWNDVTAAQNTLKDIKQLSEKIDAYQELKKSIADVLELTCFAIDEQSEEMSAEINSETASLNKKYTELRLKTLLRGEYDGNNAILSIHPGAGGTEAQDWAEMLYRMYVRYAEKKRFRVKLLDHLEGDGAGIKAVTFLIEGDNAYGYLKGENGVHRLVRISPFDSSGRRHTSFASVEVMPEFNGEVTVEISEEDIKIDTHRSSGAGGQHVNKTDSAVRITHIPTGIVVGCQSERSQIQNKETAMRMLKSKLLEIKEREHLDKISDIKGNKANIEWGSQIRSYVFMPYTLVKDNRTGCENGNIQAVMDGDIDDFINAYLTTQV